MTEREEFDAWAESVSLWGQPTSMYTAFMIWQAGRESAIAHKEEFDVHAWGDENTALKADNERLRATITPHTQSEPPEPT